MYTCNLRLEIAHRNTFNDKVKDKKRKPSLSGLFFFLRFFFGVNDFFKSLYL